MKGYSLSKPMIVTYSYSWMFFFKMYATIIIRFKVESINQPIIASEKEIRTKIETIIRHKIKRIVDYY